MWSVRAVVESVVEHGKRALHQVRRRQAPRHHPFQRQQDSQHKLSKEAITRAGWLHNPEFWQSHKEASQQQVEEQHQKKYEEQELNGDNEHAFSLTDFDLGPVIDKGCNAVVYTARWKTDESSNPPSHTHQEGKEEDDEPSSYSFAIREVVQGLPLPQGSVNGYEASTFLQPQDQIEPTGAELVTEEHEEAQTPAEKCESLGAVARTLTTPSGPYEDAQQEKDVQVEAAGTQHDEFPLAIKMMFNYEAESNAPAILKAMYKEILPARSVQLDPAQQEWQERLCGPRVCLPPHPNIVDMPCVFVDRVPLLEGCLDLYPHALPTRLNPQGYGRNMSLFCVMKRYDISLREYLQKYHPSQHTCLLLLTQLLEALLHLRSNNIAHRDLKSDNILLSLVEGWQYPLLVVSDFGCSLVGDNPSLSVPFPSREADPRQGNSALMAPEVKTAMPGLLSSVFFGQSDLWAAGTLIYEIYGLDNPFSPAALASHRRPKQLDSATYKESHLPRLPRSAPPWIRHLTADILRRNPRARPTVNVAATLCQLMLWAPSKWLSRHSLSLPTHTEVTQWLLCLATKVLCEARLPHAHASQKQERKRNVGLEGNADHQGSQLEYQLVSTFLGRVHYVDIIQAIKWNRAF
ncbi:serine/threonine-protein kinase Pink1, mitochondrial-like isoform X2 [Scylla paramamosain]|uniref:serine/threonine-protein kinase Pink1, mitochondrial-like isoform X2 n=1 Tax=Scylla paramamosain TaxID=85552 RepID=UPI003082C016